jgi:2'-5' RNA ligase
VDGGSVRTFFAVELAGELREAAAAVVDELRRRDARAHVRWVRTEALHVTLRFLGDVERGRLGGLVQSVAGETASVAPFALALGALAAFPSPRSPRVVALAVEPHEPLARAAAAVERGVLAAGFAPEERPFRGHLTLGRTRGRRPPRLEDVAVPGHAPMPVRELVLFSSELLPDGARYTPLERVALGGAHASEPRI